MIPSQPAFLLALACGFAAGAARADLSGRVVDMQRLPLAGVKVTIQPQGIVAVTEADGSFRLVENGRPLAIPPPGSPAPSAPSPASGASLGFRRVAGIPAVDLRGRHSLPGGNPWLFLASLSGPVTVASRSSLPLAKAAAAPNLVAEKPGFQTAHIPLAAGAVVPDIVMAPGFDRSRPILITGSNGFVVQPLPRAVGFSGSTSTELPNLHDPTDPAPNIVDSVVFGLHWSLATDSGVSLFVRPNGHFPRLPEGAATATPEAVSNESGRASLGLQEVARNRDNQLVMPEDLATAVNLILWKRPSGSAYGAMRCLQFPGPIKAGWKAFEELQGKIPLRVQTNLSGTVPSLDPCGKLAGRIAWKGPGPMPELWVGMIGTDFFAPVAPDGTFLSTDLPAGTPPVVLARVDRSADGTAIPRAFQALQGLAVIPGQTAILDSIPVSGE